MTIKDLLHTARTVQKFVQENFRDEDCSVTTTHDSVIVTYSDNTKKVFSFEKILELSSNR